jgi:hypothetical protein
MLRILMLAMLLMPWGREKHDSVWKGPRAHVSHVHLPDADPCSTE